MGEDQSAVTAPEQTPGCYGSVIAFDYDTNSCRGCPRSDSCQDRVRSSLVNLGEREIKLKHFHLIQQRADKQQGHETHAHFLVDLSGSPLPVMVDKSRIDDLSHVPKRARHHVMRALRSGADHGAYLRQGVNPFRAKVMRLPVDALLTADGPLTRTDLRQILENQGWAYHTAASAVSECLAALLELGLTTESQGQIALRSSKDDT